VLADRARAVRLDAAPAGRGVEAVEGEIAEGCSEEALRTAATI
jgi:hypothetical protein